MVFDDNDVPMIKQVDPNYPLYVYTPTGVAIYGLIRYNDMIENTNKLSSKVASSVAIDSQVQWLVRNRMDKGDMSFWHYNYPALEHGCNPPWRSAMGQGLILSFLLRVYHLTKNEDFSGLAARVANSMKTPTSEGGFLHIDVNGDCWYQEYMGNCGYVLNGFIYAMWGVYDYYLYSSDEEYKMIFHRCIDTLKKNLKRYNWRMSIAKWTVYDLKDRNPVTLGYQKLHVSLLEDLYTITKEEFLLCYANIWKSYINQPNMLLVSIGRHTRAQILELLKLLRIDKRVI